MRVGTTSALLLLPLLLTNPAPAAAAQEGARERETVTRRLSDDLFAAGSRVRITDDTGGDALVAGGELDLAGGIGGDTAAVGGEISLRSRIGGDLYAAGGEIELQGVVLGNARLAGGRIQIDRGAEIAGGVSAAGGEVDIDGRVGRYLQVAGGKVRIDGQIGGDVDVAGGQLFIGPDAVVEGVVTFQGPRPPEVAAGAQLRGGLQHVERSWRAGREAASKVGAVVGLGALLWLLGWMIVGAVVIALWPQGARAATNAVLVRPWLSLLVGLLVLTCMPVLILVSMITLVGIPLALLLLAAYLMLLPLGYLATAAALGEWLLVRLRGGDRQPTVRARILALLGALAVLFLLVSVPYVGGLVALLVLLAGIGSLVIAGFTGTRRQAPVGGA